MRNRRRSVPILSVWLPRWMFTLSDHWKRFSKLGVEFPPPPSEGPVATGDVDIWGSPRLLDDGQENPNYGKMVQYKNPELP